MNHFYTFTEMSSDVEMLSTMIIWTFLIFGRDFQASNDTKLLKSSDSISNSYFFRSFAKASHKSKMENSKVPKWDEGEAEEEAESSPKIGHQKGVKHDLKSKFELNDIFDFRLGLWD